MCYHIKQTKSAKEIEERFDAQIVEDSLFVTQEHINGFGFPQLPVITKQQPTLIQPFSWGLIPAWAQNDDIKKMTLNAKIETLHEKPAFKEVISQRCLVLANGFYEWQWLDSKGKKKVKYEIGIENDQLFAFAGLYSNWIHPQTGKVTNTFTIVTTDANKLMSQIHNIKKRMPVILKPSDEEQWLNHSPIQNFAFPYEVNLVAKKIIENYKLF